MWQPLNETYFVKMEEITGISSLVPEQFRKNITEFRTGIVVAVGTGTLLESGQRAPLQAVVGDRVLFGSKVGHEMEISISPENTKEKVLLLAEANILAVEK